MTSIVGSARVGLILLVACAITCTAQTASPSPGSNQCLGEFQVCPDGSCVIFPQDCGKCRSGEYLCPDATTCASLSSYATSCDFTGYPHLDPSQSLDTRVAYLLKSMNLTEKVSQLTNDAPSLPRFYIPSYNWLNDDLHGVRNPGATSFPNGCSLGATWSRETLGAVAKAISIEARGVKNGFTQYGNRGHGENGYGITLYSPNMNLVRDPRWGRAQEVYSEDPRLSSELTVSFVNGGQSKSPTSPYLLAAACCKHYAAYDLEDIPVDRYHFNANITERNMWETYMPVFKACVKEAEAAHVMCSYNAINGVPTCADGDLMNGILRKQWNFTGFVVSDYDAWANIKDTHQYCPTYECAAAVGLKAGMDQEGGGTKAINAIPSAIQSGNLTEDAVDTALARLFRVRIQLGMLDPPNSVPYNTINNSTEYVHSTEHIALAYKAAQEGMVLLKNDNSSLPLAVEDLSNIAVIGPQANATTLLQGNYATAPNYPIVTLLEGIDNVINGVDPVQAIQRQRLSKTSKPLRGRNTNVRVVDNPRRRKGQSAGHQSSTHNRRSNPALPTVVYEAGCNDVNCGDQSGFGAATSAAAAADAVIICFGLDQTIEYETHDRPDYDLPPGQYALMTAVKAAVKPGTPIIGVLIHGGTFTLKNVDTDSTGLIDAFYPGCMGGQAIADVIFGKYNPGGRLAVTYYTSNDELPNPGEMDLYAGKGATYRYYTGKPQYAFGHGLSYSSFSVQPPTVSPSGPIDACTTLTVTTSVTNLNAIGAGDQVIQLYVQQKNSQTPAPQIRLADFARVSLEGNESQNVTLTVDPYYFSVVKNQSNIYEPNIWVEAGEITLSLTNMGSTGPSYDTTVTISNSKDLSTCPPSSENPRRIH